MWYSFFDVAYGSRHKVLHHPCFVLNDIHPTPFLDLFGGQYIRWILSLEIITWLPGSVCAALDQVEKVFCVKN